MVSNIIYCYANIEKKKGKLKFIKISSSILTQLLDCTIEQTKFQCQRMYINIKHRSNTS
jgi:hypothetical protein